MRFGIDFGTTRTVVTAVQDGRHPIVAFDDHGEFRSYIPGIAAMRGAYYLDSKAKSLKGDLQAEIDAGMPPVDNNDPRFFRGKVYAIAADGALAVAGITFLTAIYYTFRDKGPASRAQVDVRALALQPQIGPTYAGLGWEARW